MLQAELAALRGDAQRALGDADAARAEYEQALALDPRQTTRWSARRVWHWRIGR
jgi:predicted negative regulator of RcsB-dependent stress response